MGERKESQSTKAVNIHREPFDVYCGRPGRGQSGPFGSPIRLNRVCPVCGRVHTDRGDTIPCFREWFGRPEQGGLRDRILREIPKGSRLGCFCAPKPCHCDVLAEFIDGH